LRVPSLTFPEVVEKVFESRSEKLRRWSGFMRVFMDVIILCVFFIGCIYYIFVAATIQEIFNSKFSVKWDVRIYIGILIIPVSLIAQIRELKHLVPLSTVANFLILGTFAITFYYIFRSPLTITNQSLISSPESWPVAITMFLFSINNIRYALSLETEMEDPRQYLGTFGVVNVASWIIAIFYTFIGFFSYLRYGDDIQSSVTLNLPMEETAALSAKIFIGLGVLLSFGFIFYISMQTIWTRIEDDIKGRTQKSLCQSLIRFLMPVVMALLAALIPNLQVFISLIGTFSASTLTFFIPILVETIYSHPDGFGTFKWKLGMNLFLFLLYILVLVSGCYRNVVEIIKIYS
jgi:proton-coupled amino acid transporter